MPSISVAIYAIDCIVVSIDQFFIAILRLFCLICAACVAISRANFFSGCVVIECPTNFTSKRACNHHDLITIFIIFILKSSRVGVDTSLDLSRWFVFLLAIVIKVDFQFWLNHDFLCVSDCTEQHRKDAKLHIYLLVLSNN